MKIIAAACATAATLTACGSDAPAHQVKWQSVLPAPGIVDLAGPRSDGRLAAAASLRGLSIFGGRSLVPFTSASGRGAFVPSLPESYIALTPNVRLPKTHCSFHRDDVFAIDANPARVVRITRHGLASNLVTLPSPFLSGIGFDRVGTFGHRLLVIGTANHQTTLYAIDCRGRFEVIAAAAPLVEGGIEVAPRSFGRFAGRLIALDEYSGQVRAFKRNGAVATVAVPSVARGADVGVESLGFVPALEPHGAAFMADLGVPGNPHPGTDSILRLTASQLAGAHVQKGDLLIASEGGAVTVAVRCQKGKPCDIRQVGIGPAVTHSEGHIAFMGVRAKKG